MIAGRAFDTAHLLDPEKFIEFFYDLTGRRDVIFKDIHTVTYWKYVVLLVSAKRHSQPPSLTGQRCAWRASSRRGGSSLSEVLNALSHCYGCI